MAGYSASSPAGSTSRASWRRSSSASCSTTAMCARCSSLWRCARCSQYPPSRSARRASARNEGHLRLDAGLGGGTGTGDVWLEPLIALPFAAVDDHSVAKIRDLAFAVEHREGPPEARLIALHARHPIRKHDRVRLAERRDRGRRQATRIFELLHVR